MFEEVIASKFDSLTCLQMSSMSIKLPFLVKVGRIKYRTLKSGWWYYELCTLYFLRYGTKHNMIDYKSVCNMPENNVPITKGVSQHANWGCDSQLKVPVLSTNWVKCDLNVKVKWWTWSTTELSKCCYIATLSCTPGSVHATMQQKSLPFSSEAQQWCLLFILLSGRIINSQQYSHIIWA